jgi:hypothetical protein
MKLFKPERKSSPPAFNRQEALKCVPLVNTSVSSTESESGLIILEYTLHVKPFFVSLFRRFQQSDALPTKKLQLDEMGSLVWKSIDGENNVQSIIGSFAGTYNITLQEAEKSVTAFLVELGKRGIIALR